MSAFSTLPVFQRASLVRLRSDQGVVHFALTRRHCVASGLLELELAVPQSTDWLQFGAILRVEVDAQECSVSFRARVLPSMLEEGTIRLQVPTEPALYSKLITRESMRIPISIPADLAPRDVGEPVRTRTLDLGVGGARLLSPQTMAIGTRVSLTLHLADALQLTHEAQVVRCAELGSPPSLVGFELRVAFCDLPAATEAVLAQFCFRCQIESRRRSLVD